MTYNLITILGPTATGKTKLAAQLGYHYNGEIISADSRQVYKGMDIGTGKDLSDYLVNGNPVNFHLIDIVEPSEEFDLFRFKKLFTKSFKEIESRSGIPFLVGGTGMYLSSILQNYNLKIADRSIEKIKELNSFTDDHLRKILRTSGRKLHNVTDLKDRERMIEAILIHLADESFANDPKIISLNIGIRFPREVIKKRITERLKKRLNDGMIEEVQALLFKGITYDKLIFFGLEYKYIAKYLKSELSYNDMFQKLNIAIHNFAKRQMTWFRKMEKEGTEIHWMDGNDLNKAKQIIDEKYF